MHPRPFLAGLQVGTRKFLYGFVSMLVIGSMLLQPVMAIAVIEQSERAKALSTVALDRRIGSLPMDEVNAAVKHTLGLA